MQSPGTAALDFLYVALLYALKVVTFMPSGHLQTPQLQTVFHVINCQTEGLRGPSAGT